MKILKVSYMAGEARFLVDEYPKTVFCIPLKDKTTKGEVLADLLAQVSQLKPETSEQLYTSLDIKSLEGTEIA